MNTDTSTTKLRRHGKCRIEHRSGDLSALAILILASFLLFNGCAKTAEKSPDTGLDLPSDSGGISKVEVRDSLHRFEEFYLTKTTEAMAEIYSLSPVGDQQKAALLGKTRTEHALLSVLDQGNPVASLFDTWALCVRLKDYFEDGEGSKLFGDNQEIAVETAKQLETEIEYIVKTLLGEEIFAETRDPIHAFAQSNPIRRTFGNMVVFATRVDEEEKKNPIEGALAVPMAPFKALEGAEQTPVAIHKFANTAAYFAEVVEGLPESIRWQLMLLLYNLREAEMVESFLGAVSELSKSSTRIAESAEKLPKELQENFTMLVKEIDEKQSNLQKTLEQTSITTTVIEGTLDKVEEVAFSLGKTANDVNVAAVAWERAAAATDQVIDSFSGDEDVREDKAQREPFKIKDYLATSENVSLTVTELRKLLAEIREFSKSGEFAEYKTASRGMGIQISWRAAVLAVIIFILCVIYKIIAVRITNEGEAKSQT